jgi:hypothetical protein
VLILEISNAMKVRVFDLALPITIVIVLSLSGCSSSTDTTEGPMTGRIMGQTLLYDMNCKQQQSSANINIQILGSPFYTTTNDSGYWTLYQVPAGYYTFHYWKDGYTEKYEDGIPFVGAGTMYMWESGSGNYLLSKVHNWIISLDSAQISRSVVNEDSYWRIEFEKIRIADSANHPIGGGSLLFFVGHHPQIDYNDTSSWIAYDLYGQIDLYRQDNKVNIGDTLYVVAYALGCYDTYENDYYEGKKHYRTFSDLGKPSNVFQIILP